MFAHGEEVTRLRAGATTDRYRNTVPDWAGPTEDTIPGCGFNPGQSSEPTELGRASVVTQPEVYAPPGSDILAGDRIVARGRTYEVDGDPADWRNPFTGWRPGLVVALKEVDG